jgi:hypothetical protein
VKQREKKASCGGKASKRQEEALSHIRDTWAQEYDAQFNAPCDEVQAPYWDCTDGKQNTRLDKFSTETLKSMKKSLEKAWQARDEGKGYSAFYLNRYDAKMNYINNRIKDDA